MNKLFSPDARMFGLLIWRKHLTDAEYIERVRKNLRMQRWLRIVCGVIGFGMVCLFALMIQWFVGFLWQWGGQQPGPVVVFLGAILLGFNVGWMFMGFVHSAATMIVESRRDRMLVECWDLLHQLINQRDAAAGGLTPDSSGGLYGRAT